MVDFAGRRLYLIWIGWCDLARGNMTDVPSGAMVGSYDELIYMFLARIGTWRSDLRNIEKAFLR